MKVLIATPCYGGQVCVNYHRSVLDLITDCARSRFLLDMDWVSGESLITRGRNELVARFLESDADTLFWIDADIGFKPEEAIRLLEAPYPVAAGVYRLKGDGAGFAADPADVGEIGEDGFARIREAPTGFMRIKRFVFELLIAEEAKDGLRSKLRYKLRDGTVRWAFFDTMICPETGEYLSEDYAFCRRCEAADIDVYVDTNSNLEHQGVQRYTGDWRANVLAAKSASEQRGWIDQQPPGA